MKAYSFTIQGNPVGKARPRMTKSGNVYSPSSNSDYEKLVAQTWHSLGCSCMTGAVRLQMDIYHPLLKGDSKKMAEKKLSQEIRPSKKPDIDNIVKIVMDGLNKLAYVDDNQVVEVVAKKWYAETGRIDVFIAEISEG